MRMYPSFVPHGSATAQQQLAPELVAAVQELINLHKLRRTSRGSDDMSAAHGAARMAQPMQTASHCQETVDPVSPQQQQTLEHLLQRWSAQRAAAQAAQAAQAPASSSEAEEADDSAGPHQAPARERHFQQCAEQGEGAELLADSRELYPVEEVEEEELEEGPESDAAGATHGQGGAWDATQASHHQHHQPLVQPLWEDAMAVYYEGEEQQQQQQQQECRSPQMSPRVPSYAAAHQQQQAQVMHRASAALARASGEFLEPEESHAAVVAPPTAGAPGDNREGHGSMGVTFTPPAPAPPDNTSNTGSSTRAAGASGRPQAAQQQQDRSLPARQLVALLQQHLRQVSLPPQQQQQPQQQTMCPMEAGEKVQEDWQQPVGYADMYLQQRRQSSSSTASAWAGADMDRGRRQPPAVDTAQVQQQFQWPQHLLQEEQGWQQQQLQKGQQGQCSSSRRQHDHEDDAWSLPGSATCGSSSKGAASTMATAAAAACGSPSPRARRSSAHADRPLQLKGRLLPSVYYREQGDVPSYATQTFSAAAKAIPTAPGALHTHSPVWHPTSCSSWVGSGGGSGQQASAGGARLRSAASSASSSRRQSRHAEELQVETYDFSRGQLPASHGCSSSRSSTTAAWERGKGRGSSSAMQRQRSTGHAAGSGSSSRRQSADATVMPGPRRHTVSGAHCVTSSSRRSSRVDLDPCDAPGHQQARGTLPRSRSLTPPRASTWGAGGSWCSPGSPPRGTPAVDDAHGSSRGADSSGGSRREERRWLSPGTGGRLFDQYSDRRRSRDAGGAPGRRDSSPGTAAVMDGAYEDGLDAPARVKALGGHSQQQKKQGAMQGEVRQHAAAQPEHGRRREATADQGCQDEQQHGLVGGAGGGHSVATSCFSVAAHQHNSSSSAVAPAAADVLPPAVLAADVLRGYTNGFVDGHLQAMAATGQEAAALQVRKKLVKEAVLHVLQTTLAAKGIKGEQAEAMQRTLSAALAAQAWPLQQQQQQPPTQQQQQQHEDSTLCLQPQLQQMQQPVVQQPPGGWAGDAPEVQHTVAAGASVAAAPSPSAAAAGAPRGRAQQQVVLGQQDPQHLQQAITAFLQQQQQGQGQGQGQVLYSRPSTAPSSTSGPASCYQQDPCAAAAGTSGSGNLQGSCYAVTAFDRETEAYLIPVMHIGVQTSTASLDYASPRSAAAAAVGSPPAAQITIGEPVGWLPPPLQCGALFSNSSGAIGLDDSAVRVGSPDLEAAPRVLEWEEAPVARPCGSPPPQPMPPSCQAGSGAPPSPAADAAGVGGVRPLDHTECWQQHHVAAQQQQQQQPQQPQEQQQELPKYQVAPEAGLTAQASLVEEGSGSTGVEAEISLRSLGHALQAESSGASSAHGTTCTSHPASSTSAAAAAGGASGVVGADVDGLGGSMAYGVVAAVPAVAAAEVTREHVTAGDQDDQGVACMSQPPQLAEQQQHQQRQQLGEVETDQQHPGLQDGVNSWQGQPEAQDFLQGSDGTVQGTLSAAAPTMCGPGVGPVAPPEAGAAGDGMAALHMDGGNSTKAVSSAAGAGQGGPVAPPAVAAPAGDMALEGEAPGSPGGAYTMQMLLPLLRELRCLRSAMSDGAAVEPAHLLRLHALLQQVVALQQHLTAKHGPTHPVTAQLAALQQDLTAWQQVAWAATSRPASRATNSSPANSSRAGSLVLGGPTAAAMGSVLGQGSTPVAPPAMDAGITSTACVAGGLAAAPQQQQQQRQGSRACPGGYGGAPVNQHWYSQQLTRGSSWSSAPEAEDSRSRDMGSPEPTLGCFPSFSWRQAPCQPPQPRLPASPIPRRPHRHHQHQHQQQQQRWPQPEQSLFRQRRLSLDVAGSGSDSSREPSPRHRPDRRSGHTNIRSSSSSSSNPKPDPAMLASRGGAATTPTTSPRLLAQALKHSLKEQLRKLRGKRSKGMPEATAVVGRGVGEGRAGAVRGQRHGKGAVMGVRWANDGGMGLTEDATSVGAYQDQLPLPGQQWDT